jgi:predicted kinase
MGDPPTILLLALVGLPGSGKSTLAAHLCDPLNKHAFNACVVAYDSAPPSEPWTPAAWHAGRTESLLRVSAALSEARARAPGARSVVIADDNAWYRSMRRPLWALARDAGAAFLSLYLEVGAAEAAARDGARPPPAHVGFATIERMARALEAPGGGSWEAPHAWVVDAAGADAARVAAVVVARLAGAGGADAWRALPVPARPPPARNAEGAAAARAAAAESLLHQVDLALRRSVGRVAAAARAAGGGGEGRGGGSGGGVNSGGEAWAAAKAVALSLAKAAAATGALQAALGGWPNGEDGSDGDGEGSAGEGGALQRLQAWADARIEGALC